MREYVTFHSQLFDREERDHYINPCCFCEDLANWLADNLKAAITGAEVSVYQEDFGWVLDIKPTEREYVVMVASQIFDDGTYATYVCTRGPGFLRSLFSKPDTSSMESDKARVIECIDKALHSEPGIENVQWWQDGFGDGVTSANP